MNIQDKIIEILKESRTEAGVSQEEIAKMLGVSKRTVQNWEAGIGSPSLLMSIHWFSVLSRQPVPYFVDMIRSSEVNQNVDDINGNVDAELISILRTLPDRMKEEILFCLHSSHGSSPVGLIEMITAYLQLPLEYRLTIAYMIIQEYELCSSTGKISGKMEPDINYVRKSISAAHDAVKCGKSAYNTMEKNDEA